MATFTTLEKLARVNPDSLKIHMDIKQLIPEKDAKKLIYCRFVDCSDQDLTQPSYYLNKEWGDEPIPLIVVNKHLDNDSIRISDDVTYSIFMNNPGKDIKYQHYSSVEEAIEAYFDLGVLR